MDHQSTRKMIRTVVFFFKKHRTAFISTGSSSRSNTGNPGSSTGNATTLCCQFAPRNIADCSDFVTSIIVGNDSDEHGCIGSAGYSYCNWTYSCIRIWETNYTNGLLLNILELDFLERASALVSPIYVSFARNEIQEHLTHYHKVMNRPLHRKMLTEDNVARYLEVTPELF